MLFKEVIAIYRGKHAKPKIQNAALMAVKANGSFHCSYCSALKG
jgi:hypothetical protein